MADKKQTLFTSISPYLKGIGQIMLQDNSFTGLLFLAGIFCGSYIMGIAAILAVITGTLTARLLKYDETEINSGLYGFSATLVGVALIVYFQPTLITWPVIVLGSILATIIQHFFIVKKIPVFTFPFILVTWVFLFIFHYYPLLTTPQPATADIAVNNRFMVMPLGFGQVIFQGNIWAGILFFAGVLISRPIGAIYAVAGAVIAAIIAYLLGEPTNDIYMGLLSYNAVLCAITFAGKKANDLIFTLIAVVLSVLIDMLMIKMGLPVLTFPFVLACWFTLIIKQVFRPKSGAAS